jgi:hypothetical protein
MNKLLINYRKQFVDAIKHNQRENDKYTYGFIIYFLFNSQIESYVDLNVLIVVITYIVLKYISNMISINIYGKVVSTIDEYIMANAVDYGLEKDKYNINDVEEKYRTKMSLISNVGKTINFLFIPLAIIIIFL